MEVKLIFIDGVPKGIKIELAFGEEGRLYYLTKGTFLIDGKQENVNIPIGMLPSKYERIDLKSSDVQIIRQQ